MGENEVSLKNPTQYEYKESFLTYFKPKSIETYTMSWKYIEKSQGAMGV